jgi:hypothetical protein
MVVRNADWLKPDISAKEALREVYKNYIFLSADEVTKDDYLIMAEWVDFSNDGIEGTWTVPVTENDYFDDPLQPILRTATRYNLSVEMTDFSTMGHFLCFIFKVY